MSNEFLTRGLESDRYLKAHQLIDQFEDEIEAILCEFGERMVAQQDELFDRPVSPSVRTKMGSSPALAYHRVNYSLDGPRAPTTEQTRRLNVHLYWMTPTEYGRTDIDGALRAFGYKIKNADPEIDDHIVEQTRKNDWPIETSGNPFDPNTVFYRHVNSAADIEETADVLVDHFSEFGGEYAVDSGVQ